MVPGSAVQNLSRKRRSKRDKGGLLYSYCLYGTLAGDGAAEEPGDEEHGLTLSALRDWRLVATTALEQGVTLLLQIAAARRVPAAAILAEAGAPRLGSRLDRCALLELLWCRKEAESNRCVRECTCELC